MTKPAKYGRIYIKHICERLRREEAEAEAAAEEARKTELKAKCEKKGLNYEEEESKYQAAQAEKKRIAEEKIALARRMITRGKLTVEEIAEDAGLSVSEVKQLAGLQTV